MRHIARLVTLDNHHVAVSYADTIPEVFRAAWRGMVEHLTGSSPSEVKIVLMTGTEPLPNFVWGIGDNGEVDDGMVSFTATALRRRVETSRCSCSTCGWDEAKRTETWVAVIDPFGFATMDESLASLVAHEEWVFIAPSPIVTVSCGMCSDLKARGIDPATLKPYNIKESA
jgi:hypothetical protein